MKVLGFLLDVIFPRWCCHCQAYGTLLCPDCFTRLEITPSVAENVSYVDSCAALCSFNSVAKSLVYTLKYESVIEITKLCARILYMYAALPENHIITAVPLHRFRQYERGFNQAEEIAKELAFLMQCPYLPLLIRKVNTQNLATIANPEERKRIITDQFLLSSSFKHLIASKNILLIDDVWTTGSTLSECAKVLTKAGAAKIRAFTFAHGI